MLFIDVSLPSISTTLISFLLIEPISSKEVTLPTLAQKEPFQMKSTQQVNVSTPLTYDMQVIILSVNAIIGQASWDQERLSSPTIYPLGAVVTIKSGEFILVPLITCIVSCDCEPTISIESHGDIICDWQFDWQEDSVVYCPLPVPGSKHPVTLQSQDGVGVPQTVWQAANVAYCPLPVPGS